MTNPLIESVAAAPVKKGKRWLVTLAKPGKGSTGFYSADMLSAYGPEAFPAGTKSYFRHSAPEDRDPRDQLGTYPDGAFWNAETQELQAELEPFPRWQPVVEEMGTQLELSMWTLNYERDNEGNITRLGPHRANSVDAVAFGGLVGSGVKEQLFESLVESARSDFDNNTSATVAGEKEMKMEEKLDKLIALFETFVATQGSKAQEEAQAAVDAKAIQAAQEAAVSEYDSKIALIEAARESLLPSQVDGLRAAAQRGEDIAPLVESAKKVFEEAKAALAETVTETTVTGRSLGTTTETDYRIGAWK